MIANEVTPYLETLLDIIDFTPKPLDSPIMGGFMMAVWEHS
jgi:hypothetical protein